MNVPNTWTEITGPLARKIRNGESTEITCCFGFRFFEHPTKGDEHPLLARDNSGRVYNTHDHELPDYL